MGLAPSPHCVDPLRRPMTHRGPLSLPSPRPHWWPLPPPPEAKVFLQKFVFRLDSNRFSPSNSSSDFQTKYPKILFFAHPNISRFYLTPVFSLNQSFDSLWLFRVMCCSFSSQLPFNKHRCQRCAICVTWFFFFVIAEKSPSTKDSSIGNLLPRFLFVSRLLALLVWNIFFPTICLRGHEQDDRVRRTLTIKYNSRSNIILYLFADFFLPAQFVKIIRMINEPVTSAHLTAPSPKSEMTLRCIQEVPMAARYDPTTVEDKWYTQGWLSLKGSTQFSFTVTILIFLSYS